MNKTLYILLLFAILFFKINVSAQNNKKKYEKYHNIANIDVQNDSIPDYIFKLKNSLLHEKNQFNLAENNLLLAIIYSRLNSFDIAIEYNLKSIELFEKEKDTLYTIYAVQNISAMYGYTGSPEISIEYSKKNLELCKAVNDSTLIQGCYINLGTNYMSLGKEKLALKYEKKSLVLGKKINDKKSLVYIYNNIGTYYFNKNNFDSAIYYFNGCLNFINNKNTNTNTAAVYSNISETYFSQKKYKEASENAKISLKYFENKSMVTDISNPYKTLIKSLIKIDKPDSLEKYFTNFIEVQEKGIIQKKIKYAAKLKILYDIKKFESEIKVLSSENKLKESKLFFITIFLVVIGIILFFIVIQNLKLKNSYKKIVDESVKSLKIEGENIELKRKLNKTALEIIDKKNIDNDEELLFEKIKEIIENKEFYKEPSINLNRLSKELDINRSYISKAINNCSKKSFVEFINEYRVTEAKRLLSGTDAQLLTLEAIGEKAGFNSKSTFFRVFKQVSGVTPNFFMKNAQVV